MTLTLTLSPEAAAWLAAEAARTGQTVEECARRRLEAYVPRPPAPQVQEQWEGLFRSSRRHAPPPPEAWGSAGGPIDLDAARRQWLEYYAHARRSARTADDLAHALADLVPALLDELAQLRARSGQTE